MPRSGKIRRVGRVNCFPIADIVAAECIAGDWFRLKLNGIIFFEGG
jgi:hypothetical protein